MSDIKFRVGGKEFPLMPESWVGGMKNLVWRWSKIFLKPFVKQELLKPAMFEVQIGTKTNYIKRPWWHFGMPVDPHFHLGKNIYLLNKDQYKRFSKGIIEHFRLKLENPKDIAFPELMKEVVQQSLIRRIRK